MQGIVTLLDPEHDALTEALWAELDAAFGLRGAYVTPYPHFSYHVARGYDRHRLSAALQEAAAVTRPFMVTTAGLAAFLDPAPVLYIPVVRTAELSAIHAALWPALESTATGGQGYYAPAHWMPHITLAHGDLTPRMLAAAIQLLADRRLNWEITVDNLAHIDDTGGRQHVGLRVAVGPA